jgi:hypothetical protein
MCRAWSSSRSRLREHPLHEGGHPRQLGAVRLERELDAVRAHVERHALHSAQRGRLAEQHLLTSNIRISLGCLESNQGFNRGSIG